MEELWIIKDVAVPSLTAFFAWLLTKRKYDAEVDKNVIDNTNSVIKSMEDSLSFYKQIVDDNKIRLQEREEENKLLREELKSTKDEVRQLREQVDYLMRFVCTNMACNSRDKECIKQKDDDTDNIINDK